MEFEKFDGHIACAAASAVGENWDDDVSDDVDAVPAESFGSLEREFWRQLNDLETLEHQFWNELDKLPTTPGQKEAQPEPAQPAQASPASVLELNYSAWDAEPTLATVECPIATSPIASASFEKPNFEKPSLAFLVESAVKLNHAASVIQKTVRARKQKAKTTERLYLLWVRQKVERRIKHCGNIMKEQEKLYKKDSAIRELKQWIERDMKGPNTPEHMRLVLNSFLKVNSGYGCTIEDKNRVEEHGLLYNELDHFDDQTKSHILSAGGDGAEWLIRLEKEREPIQVKHNDNEKELSIIEEQIIDYEVWLCKLSVIDALDNAPAFTFDLESTVSSIFAPQFSNYWPYLGFPGLRPPRYCGNYNYPNCSRNQLSSFHAFISKSSTTFSRSRRIMISAPTETVDIGTETNFLAYSRQSATSPLSSSDGGLLGTYRLSGTGVKSDSTRRQVIFTFEHDDDDKLRRSTTTSFPTTMSSVDYLLIQEDAPAESTEGLKPSVHEEDTLDHGGDITAPSSSDVKPEAASAAASVHHGRSISRTPMYEERRERAFIHGDQRVVLSGQRAYARLDEVDRVGNTFDYPAQVAYNAYFPEPERDEGDETIDQVLVQEYEESDDAGDDYYFDDTPDDNYFSD